MGMKSFYENLGLRIKLAREKAGLTQEQLIERINKSLSFMSMLEQGQSGAKVSTLRDICFSLNASADFLILGIEPANDDVIIAQKIRSLKYADRVAVIQIINSLTAERFIENN